MFGSWTISSIILYLSLVISICNGIQSFTLKYKSSIINCIGHNYHDDFLKKSLFSFGKPSLADSGNISEQRLLPECTIAWADNTVVLRGFSEISSNTIYTVAILAESGFSFKFDNEATKGSNDFLIVYGTIFHSSSYFQSVANLCKALRFKYQYNMLSCSFIDVIKNPTFLVNSAHSVPWIEVKISQIMSSIITIDDSFPSLWAFEMKIGILKNKPDENEIPHPPVCLCSENSTCSIIDPVLNDHNFWVTEILPNKSKKVNVLGSTGIAEAPEIILHILTSNKPQKKDGILPEIVFVLYTLDTDECSSCANALDQLKLLKTEMKEKSSKIYFVNCNEREQVCSRQNVTGFPTLLAYKNIKYRETDDCLIDNASIQVIGFHGSYQAQNMIEWYQDISDLGIHYGKPHNFHTGCNVHIIVKAAQKSVDNLPLSCMENVCKLLAYSECFILQENVDTDIYIESVELVRRDGIYSFIYNDGESLDQSFSRTQLLHTYHSYEDHKYKNPVCKKEPSNCISMIATFIKEHSRIPITELNPILFHSPTTYWPLFGKLPILAALVNHDTIISDSGIMQILKEVAVLYYQVLATSFVDVDRYPFWAHGMSPKVKIDPSSQDMEWTHSYPRVLIFQLHEHKQAAFLKITGDDLTKSELVTFIGNYLKNEEVEPCNGI